MYDRDHDEDHDDHDADDHDDDGEDDDDHLNNHCHHLCWTTAWGGNILGDRDHDYYDADDYYDHDGQLIMVVMLMVMISTTCAEPQGGVEASWVDLFVHAERNQKGTWDYMLISILMMAIIWRLFDVCCL